MRLRSAYQERSAYPKKKQRCRIISNLRSLDQFQERRNAMTFTKLDNVVLTQGVLPECWRSSWRRTPRPRLRPRLVTSGSTTRTTAFTKGPARTAGAGFTATTDQFLKCGFRRLKRDHLHALGDVNPRQVTNNNPISIRRDQHDVFQAQQTQCD